MPLLWFRRLLEFQNETNIYLRVRYIIVTDYGYLLRSVTLK